MKYLPLLLTRRETINFLSLKRTSNGQPFAALREDAGGDAESSLFLPSHPFPTKGEEKVSTPELVEEEWDRRVYREES